MKAIFHEVLPLRFLSSRKGIEDEDKVVSVAEVSIKSYEYLKYILVPGGGVQIHIRRHWYSSSRISSGNLPPAPNRLLSDKNL